MSQTNESNKNIIFKNMADSQISTDKIEALIGMLLLSG